MRKLLFISIFVLLGAGAASAQQRFVATLTGAQEVPAVPTSAKGTCEILLNAAQTQVTVTCEFSGLGSNANAAHTHGNGAVGVSAGILFGYSGVPSATSGTIAPQIFAVTPAQVANMRAHLHYVNIHSVNFPGGEIRGQIKQVHTVLDNDGDGRTDVTVFRQSPPQYFVLNSLTGAVTAASFGIGAGDNHLNLTCDFDGDGRGDALLLAVEAGTNKVTWNILQSDTNTVRSVQWGDLSAGVADSLAIADYDGDGVQDIAVFRRSAGIWFILESSTNQLRSIFWGTVNDQPSVGDYDGDGKADATVVRVETGQRVWYTLKSSDGLTIRTVWGASGTDGFFFFAPFDLDGDGKQDICVNRNVGGQRQFITLRSSDGAASFDTWGFAPGDTALLGDYDGDGKTDLVARRNVGGQLQWFIRRSSTMTLDAPVFGIDGDQ